MEELYDTLAEAGFNIVTVSYSGMNDEGWIQVVHVADPPLPEGVELSEDLKRHIRDAAYDVLESKFPGWEINEGSEGEITIDVRNRRAAVHHGQRYESVEYEDVEV